MCGCEIVFGAVRARVVMPEKSSRSSASFAHVLEVCWLLVGFSQNGAVKGRCDESFLRPVRACARSKPDANLTSGQESRERHRLLGPGFSGGGIGPRANHISGPLIAKEGHLFIVDHRPAAIFGTSARA